ncbi:MAG TPA: hypothetical protein VMU42_16680 [Candidatus Sulfotelmatobacter sp.]|nr:hypothetical protein [Candidatus Sulfotelmatobacter sp.]
MKTKSGSVVAAVLLLFGLVVICTSCSNRPRPNNDMYNCVENSSDPHCIGQP